MTTAQKKLTKPIPELRAELLVDKDTLRIAKALKMKIEDYVELVLEYVQNPDKEPEMYIADDEELRKLGYEPRSAEEVNEGLTKILVEGINEELKYADASDLGTRADRRRQQAHRFGRARRADQEPRQPLRSAEEGLS